MKINRSKRNKFPVSQVSQWWDRVLNFYLHSLDIAFEKGTLTSKRVSLVLHKIPEPTSKKGLHFFLLFLFLVLFFFLVSCHSNKRQNSSLKSRRYPIPSMAYGGTVDSSNDTSLFPRSSALTRERTPEQLYLKRDQLKILSTESGSQTGSMWADSSQPRQLLTDFIPSRAGDSITILIPDDLQFKENTNDKNVGGSTGGAQNAANQGKNTALNQKYDPLKNFNFQIVGIEPGGQAYLRGTKIYEDETGQKKIINIMAKVPRRELTGSSISATKLTEIALDENLNGQLTQYSTPGWDLTVSRQLSGYAPDLNAPLVALDDERKAMDTEKKALQDQQKALNDETERLKKDRQRLLAERDRGQNRVSGPNSPQVAQNGATASGATAIKGASTRNGQGASASKGP